ncbi:MAG: polysaccharide deacetylase family protein [Bacteroidota bacterium]
MLLIYTHKITPRIRYIFKQIFQGFLDVEVGFTSGVDEFIAHKGAKISYSRKPLGNELFFQSHKILFDQGLNDMDIVVTKWDDVPIFFQVGEKSAMPFDIFGASFYLLTRFEEYLPHIRDNHNRFSSVESVAYKNGFIKTPVVDIWVNRLYEILAERFDLKEGNTKKFRFESTIDVGQAYKYKMKGLIRGVSSTLADLSLLRFTKLYDRALSVANLRKDPFDSFSFLIRLQKKYKMRMRYFFLLANYTRYDRNISYHRADFRSLIKSVGDRAYIGFHPSYYSNIEPKKFKIEKERLEDIINYKANGSRQHYIKLQLPETYRNLLDNEINNDYSMGFADNIGFRASTSESFYFYDLDLELQTPLKVHPYAVSDYAMKNELKLSKEEAINEISRIIAFAKITNGKFVSLFHNDSLGRDEEWEGWRNVYSEMVKLAMSDN